MFQIPAGLKKFMEAAEVEAQGNVIDLTEHCGVVTRGRQRSRLRRHVAQLVSLGDEILGGTGETRAFAEAVQAMQQRLAAGERQLDAARRRMPDPQGILNRTLQGFATLRAALDLLSWPGSPAAIVSGLAAVEEAAMVLEGTEQELAA